VNAFAIGIGVDTTGSSSLPVDERNVPLGLHQKWKDDLAAQCWLLEGKGDRSGNRSLFENGPITSARDQINDNDERGTFTEITVSVVPFFFVTEETSRFTLRTHNEWPGKIDRLG
jgi:hypothetical protein